MATGGGANNEENGLFTEQPLPDDRNNRANSAAERGERPQNEGGLRQKIRRLFGLENLHDGDLERYQLVIARNNEEGIKHETEQLEGRLSSSESSGSRTKDSTARTSFEPFEEASASREKRSSRPQANETLEGTKNTPIQGRAPGAPLETDGRRSGTTASHSAGGGGVDGSETAAKHAQQQSPENKNGTAVGKNTQPIKELIDSDEQHIGLEDQVVSGRVIQIPISPNGNAVYVESFSIAGDPKQYQPGQSPINIPGIGIFEIKSSGSYTFTPAANWNGDVPRILYTVTDGSLRDQSSLNLKILAVDDSFVDQDEFNKGTEDHPLRGNVIGTTSSVDGPVTLESFTVQGQSFKSGETASIQGIGTIRIEADGSYLFTPEKNWNGRAPAIQYTLTDGSSTDQSQLNIEIKPINDAPSLNSIATQHTNEGDPTVTGQLTATDPDTKDSLSYSLVTGQNPPPGFSLNTDGSWTFDPKDQAYNHLQQGEHQVLRVQLQVADGHGGSSQQTLTIDVAGTNDRPILSSIASGIIAEVEQAGHEHEITTQALVGTLQGSDVDDTEQNKLIYGIQGGQASNFDSNGIHYDVMKAGTYGTTYLNSRTGQYEFIPNGAAINNLQDGEQRHDDFRFTVSDGHQHSTASRNWRINIQGGNDTPVFSDGPPQTALEDQAGTTKGQVLVADRDHDQSSFKAETIQLNHGQLSIHSDGHWEYTLHSGSTDPDIDKLNPSETLTENVTIHSKDGTSHQFTILIRGSNDAPTLTISPAIQTISEDNNQGLTGIVQGQDVDDQAHLHYQVVDQNGQPTTPPEGFQLDPQTGRWSFQATSPIYQALNKGEHKDLTVYIKAIDEHNADSPVQHLSIRVNGENDLPTANRQELTGTYEDNRSLDLSEADILRQLGISDIDQNTHLHISDFKSNYPGCIVTPLGNGNYHIKLPSNWNSDEHNGAGLPFTLEVNDGRGTQTFSASLQVAEINDRPTAHDFNFHPIKEDTSINFTEDELLRHSGANDVDLADKAVLSIAKNSIHLKDPTIGTLIFDSATNSWTFKPNQDWNSPDHGGQKVEIEFTIQDPRGLETKHTAQIEVEQVQDVAIIRDSTHQQHEVTETNQGPDASCSGQLLINDADKGESHFRGATTILTANHYGVASIDEQGHWTYKLDSANPAVDQLGSGESITDQFEVQSADGTTHTVNIVIHGTNDIPVVDPIADILTNEDAGTQRGQFHATDADLNEHPQFSLDPQSPAVPGLVVHPDGSWEFDPSQYGYLSSGERQTATVTLLVSDGTHAPVKVQYAIQIEGRNDSPTVQQVTTPLAAGLEDGGSHDPSYWLHGSNPKSGSLHFSETDILQHCQATDPDNADSGNLHVIGAKILWPGHTEAEGAKAGHLLQDGRGNYEFIPAHNFSGTVELHFVVTDGKSQISNHVNLRIDPVNDAPHAAYHWLGSTGKGGFEFTASILISGSTDNDSPNASIALKGIPTVDPNKGTIIDLGGGHFQFVPAPGYQTTGHINIHYQLTDGQDAGNIATAAFHFDPNLPSGLKPAALISSVREQEAYEDQNPNLVDSTLPTTGMGSGELNAIDRQTGSPILFKPAVINQPNLGQFAIDKDGHWSFTPNYSHFQHLPAGQQEHHWFWVETMDGTRYQQRVTINGLDDPGQIQLDNRHEVIEDDAAHHTCSGQIILQDIDDGQHLFNGENGLVGKYGILKLQPDGHYQYELFKNSPILDSLGQGQVVQETFTLHQQNGKTLQQQLIINVKGTNDAPVITQTSATMIDLSTTHPHASGDISAIDPDANEQLSYSIDPSKFPKGFAGFQIDNTGHWTFDPSQASNLGILAGQSQTIKIPVLVTDPHGATASTEIQIRLTGSSQNHLPQITHAQVDLSQSHLFVEDTSVTFSVAQLLSMAGATDLDPADKLGVVDLHLTNPSLGVFTDDGQGHIKFTPNPDINTDGKTFDFSYRITDGKGKSSDVVTVTAKLGAVNDNPIVDQSLARRGLGQTNEDQSKTFTAADLLAMCTDVDIATNNDHLSILGIPTLSNPSQGTITELPPNSGNYVFTPATDFYGEASIQFTVVDSGGLTSTGSTRISVKPQQDQATISLKSPTNPQVIEDQGSSSAPSLSGKLDISDPDGAADEHFRASNHIAGKYGYLTLTPDGRWTYVLQKNGQSIIQELAQGESLTETVRVLSKDGTPFDLNIQILGSNDKASITGNASITLRTESSTQVAGTLTVVDPDKTENGHTESASGSSLNAYGLYSVDSDGNWSYKLIPGNPKIAALKTGETLTDQFVIHSLDKTADRTITVTIIGKNDDPVIDQAHTSGFPLLPTKEDHQRVITAQELLAGISDPDGDALSIGVTSISIIPPNAGSISADPKHAGQFLFTPSQDFNGNIQLHYTVTDGHGGSISQTATMQVTPENDAPIFTSGTFIGSVNEDGTANQLLTRGTVTASDIDHDSLTFSLQNGVDAGGGFTKLVLAEGIFTVNTKTGEWSFELNNLAPSVAGLTDQDSLKVASTIQVSDGHGGTTTHTLEVTVHGHTDGPSVGVQPPPVTVGEAGSGHQASTIQSLDFHAGDLPISDLELALPQQYGQSPIQGIPYWRVETSTGDLIGSIDERGQQIDAVRLHLMPHGTIPAHANGVIQVQISLLHDLNQPGDLSLSGFQVQAKDGMSAPVKAGFEFSIQDGHATIQGVPLYASSTPAIPGLHEGAFQLDGSDISGGRLLLSIDGHSQHNAFIGSDTDGDGIIDHFREDSPWGTVEASFDPSTGKGSWTFQEGPAFDPNNPPQIKLGFSDQDGSDAGSIPLDVGASSRGSNPPPPPPPPAPPGSVLSDELDNGGFSGQDLYAALNAIQTDNLNTNSDTTSVPQNDSGNNSNFSSTAFEVPVTETIDVFLEPDKQKQSEATGNPGDAKADSNDQDDIESNSFIPFIEEHDPGANGI